MVQQFIDFFRERRGAAGAEFALLIVVFAGLLLGIIDFGRALYEYNQAQKACQVGARSAFLSRTCPRWGLACPGEGIADIPVGKTELGELRAHGVGTLDADRRQDDLAVANLDLEILHRPELARNTLRKRQLVLRGELCEHY